MDSASLNSLTSYFDNIDNWKEILPLIPILIVLELFLSADNAVALASITRRLSNKELQTIALNIGITISFLLRIILIFTATTIIKYKFIQLIAAGYLFLLAFRNIFNNNADQNNKTIDNKSGLKIIIKTILLLSITDLAFSIDSVTAAVAISDQPLLVITGAIVGILALRFTSDIFLRLLDIYPRLETAGYLAVISVATKLSLEAFLPIIDKLEYIFFIFFIIAFGWGFTKKTEN